MGTGSNTLAARVVGAGNLDPILGAGGTLGEACELCHRQFWYPYPEQ